MATVTSTPKPHLQAGASPLALKEYRRRLREWEEEQARAKRAGTAVRNTSNVSFSANATPEQMDRALGKTQIAQPASAQPTAQPTAQASAQPTQTATQTAATSASTPYLNIAQAYENKTRANLASQEAAMAQQLATSKAQTAANYDSAAAGNYVNYMKQQNAIGEQLARQGIRGGASESALARIGNNYALNQGNTAAQRYAAYGQLENAYNTNLANLRQQAEENILNNNLALQQSQIQYDDTLAQRAKEEARYREEVERALRERQEDIAREDKIRSDTWAREDLLTRQANERDDALRQAAWAREDSQLSAANAREDALRKAAWTREDELTAAANAREDARYREEVERAMRERQEDIEREAKYRYEDQDIAERRYADEQKWKKLEWDTARQDKQLEQYAATISRWTNVSSINQELQKLYNQQKSGKSTALTYPIILLLEQRKAELQSGGR